MGALKGTNFYEEANTEERYQSQIEHFSFGETPSTEHYSDEFKAYMRNIVEEVSRSTSPPWGSIRFRLALRTYAPWGVRVVSQTKSRKIPTRNILPLFFVLQEADDADADWEPVERPRAYGRSIPSCVHHLLA